MAKNKSDTKSDKEVETVEKTEEVTDESEETIVAEAPEAETVETPIGDIPVEEEPQFKNNTKKGIKIRVGKAKDNSVNWITVKPGESVTIPTKIAKANGLVKV